MNEAKPILGDRLFRGMDAATAAEKLPEGMVQRAFDCRMRSGECVTRPGYVEMGWFNPEFYPYDHETPGVTGTLSAITGATTDAAGFITSATFTATTSVFTMDHVGLYIRFDTGRVLEITAYTSGTEVTVADEAYLDYDATGAFKLVYKQLDSCPSVAEDTSNVALGVFSDPDGQDWGLIAQETQTYIGGAYNRPATLAYPTGETVDRTAGDEAFFLQCFDQVLLFRGEENGKAPLVWDGDQVHGFTTITASSDGSYTDTIPPASRAIFYGNRVWVGFDRDRIAVSDIGVYTRYYYLTNEFRLNEGNSNQFMNFFPFGKRALLVFFTNEIWLLENVVGGSDLLDNLTARRIASNVGLGARDAVCAVGDDVWFVDKRGQVWALSQVDDDRMEISGRPLSWTVTPLLDALGAHTVSSWVCAYDDGYFYLSFAAGNTSANTRTAVYDTILGAWVSVDSRASTSFHRMIWEGRSRLFMGKRSQATFSLVGEGTTDYLIGEGTAGFAGINLEVWTRAVQIAELQKSEVARMLVRLATLNPKLTLQLHYTGESGSVTLETRKTFDRTKYRTWGKTAFTITNANDDYGDPHREDYLVKGDDAIVLDDTGSEIKINRHKGWQLVYPLRWAGQSAYLIAKTELASGAADEVALHLKAWALELGSGGRQIVSLN